MSNYEVEIYFRIHYSLFDIRYSFVFSEPPISLISGWNRDTTSADPSMKTVSLILLLLTIFDFVSILCSDIE